MQVLIWYKAAGAAFQILCFSLNGMSRSNVFQVHQKQKRSHHKYIFIKFMTCDMVCNKAKTITHTFCLLFKGKKPTLGFVGPPFSPQKNTEKKSLLASRPRKKKLHSCHLRWVKRHLFVGFNGSNVQLLAFPPFMVAHSWWNLTPNIWGWKTSFGTWSTSPSTRINVRFLKTMETFVIPVGYHTEISHRYLVIFIHMKQTDQVLRWRRNNGINKYTLSDLPPVTYTWSTVAAKCPRWWSAVST